MKTIKQLKPKLNFIKKNTRPRLTQLLVTSGSIICHDLETSVMIKDNYGLDEGLHRYATLGLVAPDSDVNEYPICNFDMNYSEHIFTDVEQLEQVLKYVSKDETRLFLNGAAINGGHLVATDGHTLKAYNLHEKLEGSYILPRTSLTVLIKLLKGFKIKDKFKICLEESYAHIDTDKFKMKIRLIAREYPRWQNIIPKDYESVLTVMGWNEVLRAKDLFIDKKFKSNGCRIVASEGQVYIIPKQYPDNKYLIGTSDKDFELGFNFSYLVRAANAKDAFQIKFNNCTSPVEVNGAIVMPLKL